MASVVLRLTTLLSLVLVSQSLEVRGAQREKTIERFVHPGIVVSLPMLQKLRADVRAQREPMYTAYRRMRAFETMAYGDLPPVNLGNLSYTPHPQQLHSNGSGITAFREDAFAAYTHALLWYLEEEPRHAQKAIEIMDGWPSAWTLPIDNANGLQIAWAGAVWPRAAEIIKHTYPAGWPGAAAFGAMLQRLLVPMVDEGASTNGNIGLVMTEAVLHTAVFNDNRSQFDAAVALWRSQARAYVYVASDGATPHRPPAQRYLAHTAPVCDPTCDDAAMRTYWHGQSMYGRDGICQETCRDLGHVELGYMTLINSAETAYHQGVDLYAEEQRRLVAGAELHASLLAAEPVAQRQPVPEWLCGGSLKGAVNSSTWIMLHHHFVTRLGVSTMPNVSALLPQIRDNLVCWDQGCWEALTHGAAAVS